MIKNILLDLGGVIMRINDGEATRRFEKLGLSDAGKRLNSYVQSGFFGDLEEGKVTDEEFCKLLSVEVGRKLTWDECQWAWLGYRKDVPQHYLDFISQLRLKGYRVILASNTNQFMQKWAESDFDGKGGSIADYFDAMYRSYEWGLMKPDKMFFRNILMKEVIRPEETLFVDDSPRNITAASDLGILSLCPQKKEDWTVMVRKFLKR